MDTRFNKYRAGHNLHFRDVVSLGSGWVEIYEDPSTGNIARVFVVTDSQTYIYTPLVQKDVKS